MGCLLFLTALFILQSVSSKELSLRQQYVEADQNLTITENRLKNATHQLELKQGQAANTSQIYDEKNTTWKKLDDKAKELRKKWIDAEKVIDEDKQLEEDWHASQREHIQAQNDLEMANQVLANALAESSANTELTSWKTEHSSRPSKSEILIKANFLRAELNAMRSELDALEKKRNLRLNDLASHHCDSKPEERYCKTSRLALEDNKKSIEDKGKAMEDKEKELQAETENLNNYDAESQRLLKQIASAEQPTKDAQAAVNYRMNRLTDAESTKVAAYDALQQHAAAKDAAVAQLAVEESREVKDADAAANIAVLAKENAAIHMKQAKEELETAQNELIAAKDAVNTARSKANELKMKLEEAGEEGVSTGSIAGIGVGVILVIALIVGGGFAYKFRHKLLKKQVNQTKEEVPLVNISEPPPYSPQQQVMGAYQPVMMDHQQQLQQQPFHSPKQPIEQMVHTPTLTSNSSHSETSQGSRIGEKKYRYDDAAKQKRQPEKQLPFIDNLRSQSNQVKYIIATDQQSISERDDEDESITDSGIVQAKRSVPFENKISRRENESFERNIIAADNQPQGQSMETASKEQQVSSTFYNDFTVIRILGAGGFGVVFEAHNKLDESNYAVKRVAVNEKDKGKALSEVRAMANLQHPGIVVYKYTWIEKPPIDWQRITDSTILKKTRSTMTRRDPRWINYDDDSSFLYILMELCQFSLSDWLKQHQDHKSREKHRMKNWFKQIVNAVAYIHEKNIIHRDLKPSNILFWDKDTLKLCDLGIATKRCGDDEENSEVTRTSVGTRLYMSPEQSFYCSKYSSSTDVFTLGLILTELWMPMKPEERSLIFENFRAGIQYDSFEDGTTIQFVRMVTQKEKDNRPTCAQMLEHAFLKDV